MNYQEFIKSPEIERYFGSKHEKWQDQLWLIAGRAGILDRELSDNGAYKKLISSKKFSWLGLIFSFFWAAYHDSIRWQLFAALYSLALVLDILATRGAMLPVLNLVPSFFYAIYGKSYVFAAKAQEYSETGNLRSPSWGNVLMVLPMISIPPLTVLFLIEAL